MTPERRSPPPTVPGQVIAKKLAQLGNTITLREVSELDQSLCPQIEEALQALSSDTGLERNEERKKLVAWLRCLREASDHASQRVVALETLARRCEEFANMDFTFLYDPTRELFSIGSNVAEHRADAWFYDLLASEARLCGYVAIAQGQVSQEHWFALGRLLVAPRGEPVLASWSGSIF